mgnify:CR=1 FL=1
MTDAASSPANTRPNSLGRNFGRFELLKLLGKSDGSMVWLVLDPQIEQQLVLTLPRVQPIDAAAMERWSTQVRQAARLDHPNLVSGVEVGVQEQWPYLAADRTRGVTLGEWLVEQIKNTEVLRANLIADLKLKLFQENAQTAPQSQNNSAN